MYYFFAGEKLFLFFQNFFFFISLREKKRAPFVFPLYYHVEWAGGADYKASPHMFWWGDEKKSGFFYIFF
ncbi:UNVERIFIED_CONTAM: hypothetical protein DV031_16435 [Lacticaseibacillus paracasei]|nr:hypothetical protein [Lacticaseibacillus paracasei]